MASLETLVVAGGGGGGENHGGGGGAGGYKTATGITAEVRTYSITVGAGGAAGASNGLHGSNGGNSVFDAGGGDEDIATGGGGGGARNDVNDSNPGQNGGSGGGGGGADASHSPNWAYGTGVGGQGNRGGTAVDQGGAGGGGASAVGADGTGSTGGGGAGGAGTANSITGSSVTYAGGGGGGSGGAGSGAAGGAGGGGTGGRNGTAATAGTANTGGGGGGGYGTGGGVAAAGGSGVVIIRYLTAEITATGGTITTDGSYTIHKFTSSGTFEITAIGGSTPPTVDTGAATGVNHSSATLNGEITDEGTSTPDERGFVWGTSSESDPGDVAPASTAYADYFTQSGSYGTGTFNHGISSLLPSTTYYVRAYAHSDDGYAYGDEISFDTDAAPSFRFTNLPGIVFDEDDTTTIFAERLNDILDRLDALE